MFLGKETIFNFFRTKAYTVLKIRGEFIPPSFVPRLTKKTLVNLLLIFKRHEFPEKVEAKALVSSNGSPISWRTWRALERSIEGKALCKSMKFAYNGTRWIEVQILASVSRHKKASSVPTPSLNPNCWGPHGFVSRNHEDIRLSSKRS
jgi:hypothetical protein